AALTRPTANIRVNFRFSLFVITILLRPAPPHGSDRGVALPASVCAPRFQSRVGAVSSVTPMILRSAPRSDDSAHPAVVLWRTQGRTGHNLRRCARAGDPVSGS